MRLSFPSSASMASATRVVRVLHRLDTGDDGNVDIKSERSEGRVGISKVLQVSDVRVEGSD